MPQLRTFSAYTKNANAGLSLVARQCALSNIDGNYITGAAGQYFQIHDKATAPVNTNVPLKSFYLATAGPVNLMSIFQTLGPINFTNGLAVAISSTEATLTLGTGSFDVFGEIEEYELPISGLSTSGDNTSAVVTLQPWTTAAGFKSLYRLQLIDVGNLTATRYIMLFGEDSPASGAKPILQIACAIGCSLDLSFGSSGLTPRSLVGGVEKKGCTIDLSDTAGTYTDSGGGSGDGIAIKAYYKA